ncbi:MAG: SDR family NAD(P)-dependent oxidoreductase [Chloroflexi bacterium]|nr:SDR family NAD(P)-dependent oxidoreductase [Chloroflexota bacterium]
MSLENKVAIVAGASRGIGADIAKYLARAGAKVAVAARTVEVTDPRLPGTIHSVSEEIAAEGGAALPVVMNLRDAESITGAVEQVIAEWGRIDVLVNNAAIFIPGDIVGARERHIELSIAINLVGPIIAMRAVVPHMREAGGGHIINVSSRGSIMPGVGPYTDDQIASVGDLLYGPEKSGLEHFSQRQAMALQGDNIAVNVLSPNGRVKTPGNLFFENDPENPTLDFETADDMGKATVWMCEQDASSYTGNIVYDEDVVREHNL